MITINLVPVKEKKKRKEFLVIFSAAVALIFVVLVMAYIYFQRWNTANDLSNQIREVDKESESYQDKINEVKELESKEANLDAFKKTIKGISETQRKILVAVDQTALNLPDGVWLTNILQGTGNDENKFSIQGYSFAEENLQNYVTNLQRPTGLLKEVTVDEKNSTATAGSNKVHQFQINFRVADQGT
jgi:Tfp pilus assembly protein PilN